jgi:hypothetical protein
LLFFVPRHQIFELSSIHICAVAGLSRETMEFFASTAEGHNSKLLGVIIGVFSAKG